MNKFIPMFMAFLALVWVGARPALADALSDGQIKTAYVLNFIKFVEWPAGAFRDDRKVRLCVIGNTSFDDEIGKLNGRKAGGREIIVPAHIEFDGDLSACNVLFIGESERRRLLAIIKALGNSPVLTVSDMESFAERGGIIGLLNQDNKILFEVNLVSAQAGRLHLPGQMLNLAAFVFGR